MTRVHESRHSTFLLANTISTNATVMPNMCSLTLFRTPLLAGTNSVSYSSLLSPGGLYWKSKEFSCVVPMHLLWHRRKCFPKVISFLGEAIRKWTQRILTNDKQNHSVHGPGLSPESEVALVPSKLGAFFGCLASTMAYTRNLCISA